METKSTSSGIGIGTLLTIVFVVLKLCGVIAWSWVWVLSPLWIGLAIIIVFWIIFLIFSAIASRR